MIPIILETDRLVVREMTSDDASFVSELLSDEDVMKHYSRPYLPEESTAWLRRQIENYADQGYGFWLVADRATTAPVGLVGITMRVVEGIRRPELGYMIHKRSWRGGLATEAGLATRDYAFHRLNFESVIALIRPENIPAQGVAAKLGMTPEKQSVFNGVEYVVYSVSRNAMFQTASLR